MDRKYVNHCCEVVIYKKTEKMRKIQVFSFLQIIIFFCSVIVIQSENDPVMYPLFNGSFQSFKKYSSFKHSLPSNFQIKKLGIFLLGSMLEQYFNRGYISKNTWAIYSKYFFLVTGNGEHERNSFSNISFCTNLTHHYLLMTAIQEQQVYLCNGVHILHIPICNANSWGPNGPCCRCQGAMKFFLAMYEYSHRNSHNTIVEFPEWFIFSDDDYYIRLHLLQSILYSSENNNNDENNTQHNKNNNNYHNDHHHEIKIKPLKYDASNPYILLPYNPNLFRVPSTQYTPEYYRWGKGLEIFDQNCTRPCLHNLPWLGLSGFSIGALKLLKSSLLNNELVDVCSLWQITHDVGVGVYVWLKGFIGIPILHDSSIKQVLWHKPHRAYDKLFDEIWNDINPSQNNSFDMIKYLQYELNIGQEYSDLYPIYQLFHIHNTLLYRRIQLRNELLKEIYNIKQRKKFQSNQNFNIIKYSSPNCYEDSQLFDHWKQNIYIPSLQSFKDNYLTIMKNYEPKLCFEYSLYIANYPIPISQLGDDLPSEINLLRNRLRGIK